MMIRLTVAAMVIFCPAIAFATPIPVKTTVEKKDARTNQAFSLFNKDEQRPVVLPMPTQFEPPRPIKVEGSDNDFAYGAFQRGYYLTALQIATQDAEDGDAAAQTLLGVLYETGSGISKDEKKAAEWYSIAATNGNAQAAYHLGKFYLLGTGGLEKDTSKAAENFLQASKAEIFEASYNLGLLYLTGDGVEQNPEKAKELLELVARENDADAQYALGTAYFDGGIGIQDEGQGAFWIGRAARNDHVGAQVRYGILRFEGRGVAPDEKEGVSWLSKAAHAGNPVAMNRLAKALEAGRGVNVNVVEAAKWHLIARRNGVDDLELDELAETLSPEDQVEVAKRVREWFGDSLTAQR
ncbi:MAG: tetratricopeptide repeat protein [Stappiaceae bacterium]